MRAVHSILVVVEGMNFRRSLIVENRFLWWLHVPTLLASTEGPDRGARPRTVCGDRTKFSEKHKHSFSDLDQHLGARGNVGICHNHDIYGHGGSRCKSGNVPYVRSINSKIHKRSILNPKMWAVYSSRKS